MPTSTFLGRPIPIGRTYDQTVINVSGGTKSVSVSNSTGAGSYDTLHVMKSWTRTPNFRALIRHKASTGLLPMNPFSYYRRDESLFSRWQGLTKSMSFSDANNYRITYTRESYLSKNYFSWPYKAQSIDLNSRPHAVANLHARMKGKEWQAPVFVAESRQTMRMVLSFTSDFYRSYRFLRSGRFFEAAKVWGLVENRNLRRQQRYFAAVRARDPSRAASNALLQMRYGWLPLLSDVKDAAETLAETVVNDGSFRILVTKGRNIRSRAVDSSITLAGVGRFDIHSKLEETTRFTVYYTPTNLDPIGSFGLLSLPSVAWEIVPLSFVADWLFPVGTLLKHIDTGLRFQFYKGLETKRRVVDSFGTFVSTNPVYHWNGMKDSCSETYVEATRLLSLPAVGFDILRPDFDLGSSQFVSALALFRQRLSR